MRPPRRALLIWAFLALFVAGSGEVRAGFIAGNLGPGDTFSPGGGAGLLDRWGTRIEHAVAFTPASDFALGRVEIAAFAGDGSPADLLIRVTTDDGGQPGMTLESLHIVGQLSVVPSLVYADSVTNPTLTGGQRYWLTVFLETGGGLPGWNFNSVGDLRAGGQRFLFGGGFDAWSTWDEATSPAFRVSGDPVMAPEPGGLVLAILGVLTLSCRLRRRRGRQELDAAWPGSGSCST